MNALFQFELNQIFKKRSLYLFSIILIVVGIFSGNKFNLTAGEGIYINSPYTIGFMMGLLSLSIIFFAILYSNQLFKEWDAKFDFVFFALPVSKVTYLSGKFWYFYLKTFLSFALIIVGFIIGQQLRVGGEIQEVFYFSSYLYPLFVFGLLNCLFVCSFLYCIAYLTHRKLLVVIGGLLLYVLYMVLLVFSNSPFMSGSMPQSLEVQQISALIDPFGLSAYFFEGSLFSVEQKNSLIVPLSGMFLLNRVVFLFMSGFFLWSCYEFFSPSRKQNKKTNKKAIVRRVLSLAEQTTTSITKLDYGDRMSFKSALSFSKLDLIYLFKSIVIVAVSLLLVFYTGMEMYADIDKGIRLPEKFATSGLLATTISQNFHLLGMLILVYFINDLYWRSKFSNFNLIEKSTYLSKSKMKGHFISACILSLFFTLILIAVGLIFQFSYGYYNINWEAYLGVFVFNTIPLILFSAFLLLLNDNFNNRFISLGVSTVCVFVFASPLSKSVFTFPLLHFFSGFNGFYSDFNGYGPYLFAFLKRLTFGLGIIALLWSINDFVKTKVLNTRKTILTSIIVILGFFSGIDFMIGYKPFDKSSATLAAINYEMGYQQFKTKPQPIITDVITQIHLFPSKNTYHIEGEYTLKNQTSEPIEEILINFHSDLKIESAFIKTKHEKFDVHQYTTEIRLNELLQPNQEASLKFTLSYKWFPVNGHQSFNAIINNGSFMRISNYFLVIGYQNDREVNAEGIRLEYNLDNAPQLKVLESPPVLKKDFINLKMIVSTEKNQIAIGTGDLSDQWSKNNRDYFMYRANKIPFRFAVSSAEYEYKSILHKNISVNVYYIKRHYENVEHLINNAKATLDYCIENFGPYPFKSISFAEISSFTKGFAATAYPSTIFMTEDMIFHTNIESDKKQDVINELAGHELSHLWWGNSQINPDDREGATMLTETLAMYTEMMLYKKMHGREKMLERLTVHQQIYDSEKGLYKNQPLYKVRPGSNHISYSKGAIVMVKLSELIGEHKVNIALKNFLLNNQYPKKPTTLDLLNELYKVVQNEEVKSEIDSLVKEI